MQEGNNAQQIQSDVILRDAYAEAGINTDQQQQLYLVVVLRTLPDTNEKSKHEEGTREEQTRRRRYRQQLHHQWGTKRVDRTSTVMSNISCHEHGTQCINLYMYVLPTWWTCVATGRVKRPPATTRARPYVNTNAHLVFNYKMWQHKRFSLCEKRMGLVLRVCTMHDPYLTEETGVQSAAEWLRATNGKTKMTTLQLEGIGAQ